MIAYTCLLAIALQVKHPIIMNGDFEKGLSGWKAEGDAKVVDGAVSIGPGRGAVRQRYDVPGLRVLWFGATLAASGKDISAFVRVQCFDAKNRPVMDLKGRPDANNQAAIYLKTQAHTSYVVLSLEKDSAGGTLTGDNALLVDDDKDRVEHPPEVDLDLAMQPIWKGERVYDESVLLLSSGGGVAGGRLMFRPTKVLSVKDSTFGKSFLEGRDFTVDGDRIVALKESGIPTMSDKEFEKGEFPWTRLDGRHVFVTYEHKDTWKGPVPVYQGDRLPNTAGKLKSKKPLTIVALGDSITLGINVSGFRNVPPYLPPWPSLVARQLERATGNKQVQLYNMGLGGMNSQWAKDIAKEGVASLDPDLVLIAFGMNDFWAITPDEFQKNIESAMATVRTRRPKCEFVLIASMRFDPVYTADPTYVGHFNGFAERLRSMVGLGIALLDMTELTEALYRAKSPKDLETDPMHPDDFLARWYAQGIVATLTQR